MSSSADRRAAVAAVAQRTTARLYERFPSLTDRYGDAGRARCEEDVRFHAGYLLAAVRNDSSDYFRSYVRWSRQLLAGYGMDADMLEATLEVLGEEVRSEPVLVRDRERALAAALEAGIAALHDANDEDVLGPAVSRALVAPASFAQELIREPSPQLWRRLEAELVEGRSYEDVAVGMIEPAMYQVGLLWQQGEISVALEHLATSKASLLLTRAFAVASTDASLGERRAVFAAVEGNRHSMGLRMIADTFSLHGWDADYLGADVPVRDLLTHVDAVRPELLGLAATMPNDLERMADVIERVRHEFGPQAPQILVGGLPLREMRDAWRALGADAWAADAREAVDAAG
ncbi:MAG: cobalamin-dependent protein [Trueperaceae bacterium]|nr:cobalamin-dependent protein [Trueperaceae bacterium]